MSITSGSLGLTQQMSRISVHMDLAHDHSKHLQRRLHFREKILSGL